DAAVAVTGTGPGTTRARVASAGVEVPFGVAVTRAPGGPEGGARLTALHFSPPSVELGAPGSSATTVALSGVMSDGTAAPGNVLDAAVVVPTDPAIVSVSTTPV